MQALNISRRQMLKSSACGFGYMALAGLSAEAALKSQSPLMSKTPHFEPRAKRVIFLFMHGGPSHVDTFDYKPRLNKEDGQRLPFKAATKVVCGFLNCSTMSLSTLMICA